jgi:uncharacterized protein YjbJ (UPF0337 family)
MTVARSSAQVFRFITNETKGVTMNRDRFEGNWKQLRGKVKEQWGKLTDDQLDMIEGKRDQLSGKIQEAYGISRDEAERQLDEWERRNLDSDRPGV